MLKINEDRLLNDLRSLWSIGETPDGGVNRVAFSELDVAGRNWFKERVEQSGLLFTKDGAGNLFASLPSSRHDAPTLLCGSHLDSVPNGGRYDGALGVLSALEAIRTLNESGLSLPVTLSAVSFTDEEGGVVSMFGSHAFTGTLSAELFHSARPFHKALVDGMKRLNISAESAQSVHLTRPSLVGFLEVHIEQGTRLETAGIDIGVVTSIVGIRTTQITWTGEAAHAGAKPMADRRDALWGASAFITRATELIQRDFHPGVCNVGAISAEPGAYNIVPARVTHLLEFRHGSDALMDAMFSALTSLAEEIAHAHGLLVSIDTPIEGCVPAPADERLMAAIEVSAETLGLSHRRMMSFAGHDTQTLAQITPSAMFFVPSVAGVSHNPAELTRDEDCVKAANVLVNTLVTLANEYSDSTES